jgi:type IV pilus assembly protein PilW
MPATRHFHTAPARGHARGFTLVEVLVALAIGSLILIALTILFWRNSGNQSELERSARQLESARFALDALTEDLMHAGFYGEFNPNTLPLAPAYQTPDACATATTAQGWDATASPVQIPMPVQGIGAAAVVGCLSNRVSATEAVTIRRADTGPAIAFAGGNASNLYVQVARCGLDAQRLVVAAVPSTSPESTFTLRVPDCTTVNNRIRRVSQRTYYVASCSDCAAADGIPTLKRVEAVDGDLLTVSVAEGVENIQFEYGIDIDNDGQPDSFTTSAGVTGAAPNVWNNVVAVRVHMLTRATAPVAGYVDSRTYRLGPAVTVSTPSDGFKRTLLTTTVRLVNVGMRRE